MVKKLVKVQFVRFLVLSPNEYIGQDIDKERNKHIPRIVFNLELRRNYAFEIVLAVFVAGKVYKHLEFSFTRFAERKLVFVFFLNIVTFGVWAKVLARFQERAEEGGARILGVRASRVECLFRFIYICLPSFWWLDVRLPQLI